VTKTHVAAERVTGYRVAVVGSGPSGFYAAEALLRSEHSIAVDMFERLPVPYGLVRFGVAPDHPKLKQVTRVFDRIARMRDFRFFGGVEIGKVLSIATLQSCYHAVILATGASVSRRMQLPGEALPGSFQAADFVAWYNGHPDFCDRTFDLGGERAVIIGHGNVALDVARMLAKTPDELRHTDIAAYALDALAGSRIREIHVIGRGGPERTRFAAKELQEFTELADCDPATPVNDFSNREAAAGMNAEAEEAFTILREFSGRLVTKRRRCVFRFGLTPLAIEGEGRVHRMLFRRQGGDDVAIDCDVIFFSIGRRSAPLCGIPYDEAKGVHGNVNGRLALNGAPLHGLYVCGWGKRGPQGTIGTNRGCSIETVDHVLADLPRLDDPRGHPDSLFAGAFDRVGRYVDYAGWERIDAVEVARGQSKGKPREKIVLVDEMVAAACGGFAC
jgi:ferredoxin/flavodoxin---NADP+ reductase